MSRSPPAPSSARLTPAASSQGPLSPPGLRRLPCGQDAMQRGPPLPGASVVEPSFAMAVDHSPSPSSSSQSCLKRGLGATCAYPDPDADPQQTQSPGTSRWNAGVRWAVNSQEPEPEAQVPPFAPPPPIPYPPPPMHGLRHPPYYDYTGTCSGTGASTSTFRPNKRPRNLTEEEAAAITRNFTRGAFFVGQSEPIRIDPRLPVRLTLAEGDQVHFLIGETAL